MHASPLALTFSTLLSLACGLSSPDRGEHAQGAESTPTSPGDGPRGLRIATWNLEWLNRRNGTGPVKRSDDDYARLRGYAQRLDADVIAFQEVDGPEAAARIFDPSRYELFVADQNDPQRTGFAVRKGVSVVRQPDYAALDVGQVRVGVDIAVTASGKTLRLLSVHLKSGCFDAPLTSDKKDCKKLAAQLAPLEGWVDARAKEGVAALVLGDWNRRLFGARDEPFWRELDDADPPASDLWAPTEGQTSRCWGGEHAQYIDHIVLNKPATQLYVEGSFAQLLYDAGDASYKKVLSDHCPQSIALRTDGTLPLRKAQLPAQAPTPSMAAAPMPSARGRIKGNIGSGNRKTYHAPGCPEYERTQIDERKGERWFESEAEAQAAGWTRAANCQPGK